MSETRNDILEAALELYNRHGIEQVSTRDIARKIGISSGNLTYHFPTRNAIFYALMGRLLDDIDRALSLPVNPEHRDPLSLCYHQCLTIINKQLDYEFIFNRRYAELITALPEMQKLLQEVLDKRFDQWKMLNEQLVKSGLASEELKKETHAHSQILNIIGLYWHQEVAIYYPQMNREQKTEHAVALIFQSYKPYLTKKGLSILKPFIKKLGHYKAPLIILLFWNAGSLWL